MTGISSSIEKSNILEYLQWSDIEYRLDEFVDRFSLPQIVKVQEYLNIPETNISSCFRAKQLLTLHAVESTEKVLVRDRRDRQMHLPLDCPKRIELRPHSFRGVCEKVAYLCDFKFVRVTQGYFSLDDESCTISPGDKLEVIGVEAGGTGGREGCLVFQNQVQFTIRLPFSVTAGFQPLVDGREYSLKEVIAMEQPVYFQFIAPPDPIGQERVTGMFNSSLGVLKLDKVFRDSIVICTAMSGCATTAVVYPKLFPMKVLATLKKDENYEKICRMFHDRISLSKVSDREVEKIYASRNTIREYQDCIEEGFAFLVESIGDGMSRSLDNELNNTEPTNAKTGVTKGFGDPEVPIELSVCSGSPQDPEKISGDCHDIVSTQPLLTDEHSAVPNSEPAQGVGNNRTGNNGPAADCPSDTATDVGKVDLSHPASPTDRLWDEAVQKNINHMVVSVQNIIEADQITDTQQHQPLVGEQGQNPPARRTEEDEDTNTMQNEGLKVQQAPLGKTNVRLNDNASQIDSSKQESEKCNADTSQLGPRASRKPPPVREKPKRKISTPERLSSAEPVQLPIHGTADMKTAQAFDKVANPKQRILNKTTSAPEFRRNEGAETQGLFIAGPEQKAKPKLPAKPSAARLGEIRAQKRVELPRQGPPLKAKPVFKEPPPSVYENSDTILESGCPTQEVPPTTTEPSRPRTSSLPVETDINAEEFSVPMETESGYLDGGDVQKLAKPVDKILSLPLKMVANISETDESEHASRKQQRLNPARASQITAPERKEGVAIQGQPPPHTKPKPSYLSHPVAGTEETYLERGASSTERQPPPVKPKPVKKEATLTTDSALITNS